MVAIRHLSGPRTARRGTAVSRRSARRWLLRDITLSLVLFVWVAFGFSILIYFFDWVPVQRETAARPQMNHVNDDKLYTGSIIIVPRRGDLCWERMLDNRTGKMWDKGYVRCDDAVTQPSEKHPTMGDARMRAIGKALLHKSD